MGADLSRYDDALEPLIDSLPGPDLAVRPRAAFAWQDEVLAQLV